MPIPRRLSPIQTILASFVAVILLGTVVLTLPIAQRSGAHVSALNCLFTATSATCMVGLSPVNMAASWSTFGLIIILIMIQVGAIAYMSAVMLIALLMGVRMGMSRNLTIIKAGGVIGSRDMLRIVRVVTLVTLALEAVGALLLAPRFALAHGEPFGRAVFHGIFYGIASFCNTGFMLGDAFRHALYSDAWLMWVISSLVILGGLGVGVLIEIGLLPRTRTFSLHTKLALVITVVLLVLGAVLFYLFEAYNPDTLRHAGSHPLLTSWFMSASARSAGFSPVNLSAVTPPALFILALLTIVGASPGGTGGGVKTVTLAVIVLAISALVHRRMDIDVFKRRLGGETARLALSLVSFYILLLLLLVIGVSLAEVPPGARPVNETMSHYGKLLFTVISSLGAVGWDAGIASTLHPVSRVLLIVGMFIGRLGTLIFVYVFARAKRPQLRRLPSESVMTG